MLRLRPAFLPTVMATPLEPNPEQASQVEPTVEKMDEKELLEWIERKRPKLLKGDKLEKFERADLTGEVFLDHAGKPEFFQNRCGLSVGLSEMLAKLGKEVVEGETAGIKSKLLSFILCTPRRH